METQAISKLELDILIHEYQKKQYNDQYDARLKSLLEERDKNWNPISLEEFNKRVDQKIKQRREIWMSQSSK